MNLSEINSPAELMKANELSPEEQAIVTARDMNPDAQLEMVKLLLADIGAFHQWVINKRAENDQDIDPQWFVDLQSITFALKIIKTVEL